MGAAVGAEEGTSAGTGTGLGMVFELDAVLSPLVKTPYSAFGHTHHITGKRRGEERRVGCVEKGNFHIMLSHLKPHNTSLHIKLCDNTCNITHHK
jgi:hypothetical protein